MLKDKFTNINFKFSDIFFAPEIPPKKLNNAIKVYGQDICKEDVIALVDDTLFGSSSEGILLTDTHILYHELLSDPIKIEHTSINAIDIDGKKIIINNKYSFKACIDEKSINMFYNIFKDYIFNDLNIDKNSEYKKSCQKVTNNLEHISDESLSETIKNEVDIKETNEKKENDESYKDNISDSDGISNKFFGFIAKLDGYSIIIVSFLRNNAPDRVLSIIQKLPGIGLLGYASRLVFAPALKWLNDQIMKNGESYIMIHLITNFKERGISNEALAEKIKNAPVSIIGEDIQEDSLALLNKYYPSDSIEIEESNNEELSAEKKICKNCGNENSITAKFCSNCGKNLIIEYVCNNCGFKQSTPMKFCPECGTKFNDNTIEGKDN